MKKSKSMPPSASGRLSNTPNDTISKISSFRPRYSFCGNVKHHITCTNCNGHNHLFKDCKKPIQSNGILAWTLRPKKLETVKNAIVTTDDNATTTDDNATTTTADNATTTATAKEVKNVAVTTQPPEDNPRAFHEWMCKLWQSGKFNLSVCLIQRRHTISYEAFVRGKYTREELHVYRDRMTSQEIERIRTNSWEVLYSNVMAVKDTHYMQREKRKAKQLYDSIDIVNLTSQAKALYHEPTWEFPKGRRFAHETDQECALREFEEETGVPVADTIATDQWVEEEFCGLNKRMYRNRYCIAFVHPGTSGPYVDQQNASQTSEINAAKWCTYEESLKLLRPFHPEKHEVLKDTYKRVLAYLSMKKFGK